jgi:hypothetical protein
VTSLAVTRLLAVAPKMAHILAKCGSLIHKEESRVSVKRFPAFPCECCLLEAQFSSVNSAAFCHDDRRWFFGHVYLVAETARYRLVAQDPALHGKSAFCK